MFNRQQIATTLLCAAIAGPAAAHGRPDRVDYARVTRVEPITRLVEVSDPHRECWDEAVEHRERGDDRAGLVLGGIVGGVVGNRFGGGTGRTVATVAGTILGAGIGNALGGGRDGDRGYVTEERRCRTVDDVHTEQRTIGYRVHYRYHGEEFVTQMDHDP
ncbi:MAG TPA: glycine zipper 2TM domain-containing protein, partial [Gammaproteobacteria bacterium]|nr:glycine zipper 2TM domain-containing protein [Gammaproteobacteria bacterium]